MPDVAVVGSVNLDLVATTPRLPGPGETVTATTYAEHAGGKGLNQAVAAARAGARVAMVGAVGADDEGARLRSIAASEGVDVSAILALDGQRTGRALITVDEAAENSIVVIPGANASMTVQQLPAALIVLAQLETPIEQVTAAFEAARASGARTVLNPAPARPLPDDLVGSCDIVIPNEHELAMIGGVESLLTRGVSVVVITRGSAGVDVVDTTDGLRRAWTQQPFPVTPVDTTGAGDAFCGALAARLAAGDDLESAVRFAAAAGALATTTPGAVPSLPHLDAIRDLLERHP